MYRGTLTYRSLGTRVKAVKCSILNSVSVTLMLLIMKLCSKYVEPFKTTGQKSVFVHLITFCLSKGKLLTKRYSPRAFKLLTLY